MAFVEDAESLVVDRFERRNYEQTADLREAGPQVLVVEDVFDLGRAVETQIREARVDRLGDSDCVPRPVQEVRITEGDVPGAHGHELGHVAQYDLFGYDTKTTVVHDRQRAVTTAVRAAVARLDCAGESLLVAYYEPGVAIERRQKVACRCFEATPAELNHHVLGTCGHPRTTGPVRPCH